MDSLQSFLLQSFNSNTLLPKDQMDMVSSEISSAIQQIIDLKLTKKEINNNYDDESNLDENKEDCEMVELDAVELLTEHIHFCEICGKGFKRDANLRMHMRAHGIQYKTPDTLSKKGRNILEQSSSLSSQKTQI
ncbi:hypothetical protein SLEP1_g39479 [Rubroshorea leprosula]|uniref:C2H2-type domain-containing protein n=1 Tax=Rubroshorea leprosula TaxID=152421 RepID=A0AAV5L0R0_9ROSI|nr:hypothetical protein SLEP1_g39479 [Rubroshorea leprosula]